MNRIAAPLVIMTGLSQLLHTSLADTQKIATFEPYSHRAPSSVANLSIISNNFTCTLVRTLLSDRQNFTDFLVSAFNIQEAIFLLLNAAQNRTYAELARVYGLPDSLSSLGNINAQFKTFLQRLQVHDKEAQVDLTTALYVQKECPLRPCYVKDMAYNYAAETSSVDFQRNATKVTDSINAFVNRKTRGKIPKLYEQPLPPDTRLVILAVLYFNSSWYDDFFILNDKTSTFNLLPRGTKQLQYLNNHDGEKKAGYTVLDSCQVVRILYSNTNYSFYVFLPPPGQDPVVCLRKLTTEKIANLYSATDRKQSVNVTLPRFAFDHAFDNLVPCFEKLGVRQLFGDANLQRAVDQCKCDGLRVSQIIHKCRIEVSEKGTTAVAVTSISVRSLAMPIAEPEPIQFFVNRPFAFMIAASEPRIILFTGRCANPIYPNH